MKPVPFTCLVASLIFIISIPASAQISEGGVPPSFSKLTLSAVPTVATPPVDAAPLLAEDKIEEAMGLPFRFGQPFDVDYSLNNSGTWDELPDGGRIWRLKIYSPGAYSINLIYSRFWLPPGAKLFVYDASWEMIIGAFTERNNKDHGQFATGPVKGDMTVLEYYEPAGVRGQGEIAISRIVHAYKDVFFGLGKDGKDYGESGSCNNNVNCPEGVPWQDDIRSAAMILTSGGFRLCSGAMVNNVRQDRKSYFLTANHCLGGESTWIFMFNYQSPTCANINGPTGYTVSGCTRRAAYATSDFGLLELSEQPPDSYNVYYSGWTNIDTPSQSSTCIHHPSGDIKKISFDYEPVTSADYLGTSGTTHWRIGSWNDGTTEPGSSGSPLFDQNHRVVGQLHGGYASCTSITSDWYGKFAMSWNGGGSAASRLKDWLDPDNTGAATLDGYDPNAGVTISHTPLNDTRDTLNDYETVCLITSNAALVANQLLLHYQLASTWYSYQLQPTGMPDEYHGFIPAQPAGTTINYYLTAADINGSTDTTDVFSFFVDYTPAIAVAPGLLTATVNIGDSAMQNLIVQNAGNGTLDYTIGIMQAFKSNPLFSALLAAGEVEPARRIYPDGFNDVVIAKGDDDPRQGYPVEKNAGGPDTYGYVWVDSDENGGPAFNWIDISATGTDITAALDDDNYIGPLPIGFGFPFYGNIYTDFYFGSNGIIGFDTAGMSTRIRTPLPTGTKPNNILAWLWDDLDITDADNTGGRVYLQTDGSRCIIQIVAYPEYRADPGDVVTAEVILDADGTVTIQYLSIAPGFDVQNCTVGIENASGTDGLQVVYLAAYLHDNLAIKFFMPYQWLTVDQNSGSLLGGKADTILCTFITADLDTGLYHAQVVITSNDPDPQHNPVTIDADLTVILVQYLCGDANGDEAANLADAVYIINYVFKGGPAPDPLCVADANDDDAVNLADAVHLVNYVFKGGPPPAEPCCP